MKRIKKEKPPPGRALTRSNLYDALCRKLNIKRERSIEVVESVLDALVRGIVEDGEAKISSFGVFHAHEKKRRVARNPKTGEKAAVEARKSLSFRPSQLLKVRVDKGET